MLEAQVCAALFVIPLSAAFAMAIFVDLGVL